MWTVTILTVWVFSMGQMQLMSPELEMFKHVYNQPPAATQEACRIAAIDAVREAARRNGSILMADVECEKQGAA